MNKQAIINKTAVMVHKKITGQESVHDWWHTERVWRMAKYIAAKERADQFIVQITALVHDLDDYKLHHGNTNKAKTAITKLLRQVKIDGQTIKNILKIITDMSFKGSGTLSPMQSLEGKIVQDADHLDGIGAIGIARAFAFGGYLRRPIYDPTIKITKHASFKEWKKLYKKNKPLANTTINHFYEKLLLLKDRMNTKTAKKIATKRHQYMKEYLSEFYKEQKLNK
ncbi:MAG: HD domain-containing protein [Patescibacteria group bacterium]